MNEQLKIFLIAFLKVTLGMEETEASKLFKDDGAPVDGALEILKAKDVERVKVLKDASTAAHDKGYSKAKGEVLAQLEADLKSKHSITSDKKGIDLVEEIISIVSQKNAGSPDPTEDQIKRHPLYQQLKLESDAELKKVKKEMQDKIDEAENNSRKKAEFESIKSKALIELEEMGAIESDVPEVREYHRGNLIRELEKFEYDNAETDSPIIKKNGELHTDDHSRTISFKELVGGIAKKMYVFKAAEERSSGGPAGTGKKPGSKVVVKKPKTQTEFQDTLEQIESSNMKHDEKLAAKLELNRLFKEAKADGSLG